MRSIPKLASVVTSYMRLRNRCDCECPDVAMSIQYEIGRARHEGLTEAEIVAALARPMATADNTDDTHRIECELLGAHTVVEFFDDLDPSIS